MRQESHSKTRRTKTKISMSSPENQRGNTVLSRWNDELQGDHQWKKPNKRDNKHSPIKNRRGRIHIWN